MNFFSMSSPHRRTSIGTAGVAISLMAISGVAFPQTNDASGSLAREVHRDGWTQVGVYTLRDQSIAVFVKPEKVRRLSSANRTIPVRFEFKNIQGDLGLSNRMIDAVDCASRKIKVLSAMLYPLGNLEGSPRPANGWNTWQDAPVGSADADIILAACAP